MITERNYIMGELNTLKSQAADRSISLEGQEKEFSKLLKAGIYKELYKKGLITDLEFRKITI